VSGAFLNPRVRIPVSIEQGDTTNWTDEPFMDVTSARYTSSAYGLKYTIVSARGQQTAPLTISATPAGSGWVTQLTAIQSGALAPGVNLWQATLTSTDSSFVGTVARGELDVVLNLASLGAGYDARSVNQQRLEALQAALAALTGSEGKAPVMLYRIGTREMRYQDVGDILKAIAYYQTKVNSESNANSIAQGQGNKRKTYFRFPGGFGGRE
jgi:hypothetical protein